MHSRTIQAYLTMTASQAHGIQQLLINRLLPATTHPMFTLPSTHYIKRVSISFVHTKIIQENAQEPHTVTPGIQVTTQNGILRTPKKAVLLYASFLVPPSPVITSTYRWVPPATITLAALISLARVYVLHLSNGLHEKGQRTHLWKVPVWRRHLQWHFCYV